MTEYGSGGGFTVRMDGPYAGRVGSDEGGGSVVKLATISVPASAWKGGTSPYSQEIHVDGISVNSVVDINLSTDQIEQLRSENKNIAFTTENDAGVVTLIAIGSKPSKDLVFQTKIVDVLVVGASSKLLGNTITIHQESLPIIGGTMKGAVDMGSNILSGLIEPTQNDHAVSKKYADAIKTAANNAQNVANTADKKAEEAKTAAENAKAYTDSKHLLLTKTLSTSWSGNTAPYKQSVTVNGLLETDTPHVTPVYSGTLKTAKAQAKAWALVSDADAAEGAIVFSCFEDKPITAIPIQIEVNR